MYQEIGKYLFLASIFVFLLMAFKDRFYGLISYSIVYFTRITELFPGLGKIRFEFLLAGFVLYLIWTDKKSMNNLRDGLKSSVIRKLSWFLAAIFLSIPFSFGILKSLEWFIDFVKMFLFCMMIMATIDSDRKLRYFLWSYAILIFWLSLVPFTNYLEGNYYYAQGIRRISGSTGFFSNPNLLACTLAQSIPLMYVSPSLGKSEGLKRLLRGTLILAFLGVMTATIIFTGSRGGFLALIGVAFLIWFRSKKRFLGGIAIAILMGLMVTYMGKEYQERQMTTLEMGESDESAKSRVDSVRYSLEMLWNKPLLGYGFGCFANARYSLGYGWLWPHNIAAQLIGELGLIGIVTFVLFVIAVFKTIRRVRRHNEFPVDNIRVNDALENAFISQFVIGITQHNLHLYMLYLAAFLVVVNWRVADKMLSSGGGIGKKGNREINFKKTIGLPGQ